MQPNQQPNQQPDLPPLSPGDPVPMIILPDAAGNGVNLGHQSLAGRWQVLVFVEPGDISARSEAIKSTRERLTAAEGVLFTIAFAEPDADIKGADLFDASHKAAALLLGRPLPGIAVISPEGRLMAQLSDADLDQAATFCRDRYDQEQPTVVKGFAPVLVVDDVLGPDLCRRILGFWQDAPKTKDGVASAQQGNEATVAQIKRRTDAVIQDGELFEQIKARIGARVLPLVGRAFHMRTASMEAPRIGCYDATDHGAFGRHRDNTTPYTAHRRFAMTLNLNAGDYEGGALRFPEYGRALYSAPTGGAVIFSCSLLHEALPVTKGRRFAMFTFLTDAAGLEQEKAMHAQMQANQGGQA